VGREKKSEGGRRGGEEEWGGGVGGKGVRGLTDVNQVDLLSFLHELEGNLNVLSLLNREARVCLGSAVEWVKGEEGEKGEYSDCSYHNYKKPVYSFPLPSRCTSLPTLQDVPHFHFH